MYRASVGSGHELLLLDEQLKGAHPITGIDLSPGMIQLANQLIRAHSPVASPRSAAHARAGDAGRTHLQTCPHADTASPSQHGTSHASPGPASQQQQQPRLRAVVGDATVIPEACFPAAAVLSVFGLQQMTAEANTAVCAWVSALSPGGVASIIFWPPNREQNSPWARFTQAPPWDASLVSSALAVAGVRLCEDRLIRHPFEWPSLSHFWEVMTRGGPWCARRIAFGDAHMDELYVRFAALYAEQDGVADDGAPLLLAPEARLLVFTRDEVQPCFCLERTHSRL
ncbi:MAG: hypothetical protein WDW36_004117 [Sanguina aurantia]